VVPTPVESPLLPLQGLGKVGSRTRQAARWAPVSRLDLDTVGRTPDPSLEDASMRIRSQNVVASILAAGLVLAACSGSDQPAAVDAPIEGSTDDDAVGDDADDAPMGDGMDRADSGAMGEPAAPSEATRTISVEAFDMAFDPETISVEPGEVVTFEVTNTGEAVHEFFLGDRAMQQEHADEMADMDGNMAHDEPYSIRLEPGETKELTWRFAESGEIEFACHEPGHYQAGMHGRISVG
jgi:uncharacterized cupredoxin-like copper-binding protein